MGVMAPLARAQMPQNLETRLPRQIDIQDDYSGAGRVLRTIRPIEELGGLLAIARDVQKHRQIRHLDRLLDQERIRLIILHDEDMAGGARFLVSPGA